MGNGSLTFQSQGKYDDIAEAALITARARLVILAVVGGDKGHGFSVSVTEIALLRHIPALLEKMASELRETLKEI